MRVLVGDWDGDGKEEPASIAPSGLLRLARQAYDFTSPRAFTHELLKAGAEREVIAGDLNGDKRSDLAVRTTTGTWSLILNMPDGTFAVKDWLR